MKQIKKMVEVTKYAADDGTEFDDECECECYEKETFFKAIHAFDESGNFTTELEDVEIFTIQNINQINKLKEMYQYDDKILERLKFVTDIGIYFVRNDKRLFSNLLFYKYPENF